MNAPPPHEAQPCAKHRLCIEPLSEEYEGGEVSEYRDEAYNKKYGDPGPALAIMNSSPVVG